ncbi:MAG: flotillin family protein [Verrucomicrobiae bacterium]|nr:flotillin family protein [Verrucomicrobiae bacterium]
MNTLAAGFMEGLMALGGVVVLIVLAGIAALVLRCYRKVEQGKALVRNGFGGTKVSFSGIVVFPVLHRAETMDISVKRVEIDRQGKNGLICMDNMRADIKVAFFVRVNQTPSDVLKVAQSIGCVRASSEQSMVELFDAKFSEALKTVGRQFNFVDLYNSREKLKEGIISVIGTDLNGFVLEDVAIDFLEQTPIALLNPDNILDSEGIKKITELTAAQKVLSNHIDRDREKTITKQNVEAQEAILELNRQLAEAEEKQKREIASIKAREEAEARKVQEEQRLRSEQARIATDEEVQVAEENKNRQVIVAQRNRERTDAVERERVEKDRLIEQTERERVVTLAQIEKEKVVEAQKKAIQNTIRERLEVEKTVVLEQQRIKDAEAFATADRDKKVAITAAEQLAEEALVRDIKAAEAARKAAELRAEQERFVTVRGADAAREAAERRAQELLIAAEAEEAAALKQAAARKELAAALSAETAAVGLAEVQVIEARAEATRKQGSAEAEVMQLKFGAEAEGITRKAEAMKEFDGVGREHEEFKLRLNQQRDLELAGIEARKAIADSQAAVLGEALKHARVDIVGGETQFFDRLTSAITGGKAIDRWVDHSRTLADVKETFFNGDPEYFRTQVQGFIDRFGIRTEDLKNLSVAALLGRLIAGAEDASVRGLLTRLLARVERAGTAELPATDWREALTAAATSGPVASGGATSGKPA